MEDKKDGTSEEINLERDENILKVMFFLTFGLLQVRYLTIRHASSHTVYQRQCLHSITFPAFFLT